jgi:hypothetical protein
MTRTGKEGLEILDRWWGVMMIHKQKEFRFSDEEVAFKISKLGKDNKASYAFVVHPRIHKNLRKCFKKIQNNPVLRKDAEKGVEFRGTRKIFFKDIGHAIVMKLLKEMLELCGTHIDETKEIEILKRKKKLEKVKREARMILEPIYGNSIKVINAFFVKDNPPEKKYCLNIKIRQNRKKKVLSIKIFSFSPRALREAVRKSYEME